MNRQTYPVAMANTESAGSKTRIETRKDPPARPQPTGVHSSAMMNVGGKIVIECVPDQKVSGSTPIVPVDSRFPFSSE
jgi:hypothetical protein